MIEKYRTELNNTVKEWGNETQNGLGDLLTAEVNFRKLGGAVGFILPFASGINLAINYLEKGSAVDIATSLFLSAGSSLGAFAGAAGGYILGKKLDNLIEKSSFKPMCKYARRQENANRWSVLK
jgi:hypothetical protein